MPWPLCACAKVLPHVAAFNVIMSHAPPVSVLHHNPRARQATVQPEARTRIIARISWLTAVAAVSSQISYQMLKS